jgi:hypothetical protein
MRYMHVAESAPAAAIAALDSAGTMRAPGEAADKKRSDAP